MIRAATIARRRSLAAGRAALLLGALGLMGGCATFDTSIPERYPPRVNLGETPFHAQLEHHCGPAALLTVLEASGVTADYEAIVDQVYVPGLEGSLQVEMMAAARGHERIPFRVPGTLEAIAAELDAGHPVLILQNLRLRSLPAWHYAVVVGYDRDEQTIRMRSGTERDHRTPAREWMRQWDWASRWGIVVLPPGTLPVSTGPSGVFRALADFDERGHAASRLTAWSSALERWPDQALAHFGTGNALFALGRLDQAIERYRATLVRAPDHWPARLNLAQAELDAHRPCAGLAELEGEEDGADSMGAHHPLHDTRQALAKRLRAACRAQPEPASTVEPPVNQPSEPAMNTLPVDSAMAAR